MTGPADQTATEGTSTSFSLGSFSDAGVNDNPWKVHIAWGDFLAVRQGEKKLEDLEHLNQAATALVNDVAWWAKALKKARDADVVDEEIKAA